MAVSDLKHPFIYFPQQIFKTCWSAGEIVGEGKVKIDSEFSPTKSRKKRVLGHKRASMLYFVLKIFITQACTRCKIINIHFDFFFKKMTMVTKPKTQYVVKTSHDVINFLQRSLFYFCFYFI